LILTNDGPLARRLMHPSSMVPKVYRVKVEGLPDEADLARLRGGRLWLGDRPVAPAGAEIFKTAREGTVGARAWLSLTLTEGRRRQVKRMCSAIGHPVLKLKRVSYAGLELGRLGLARIRPLTPAEVRALKQAAPP
jgi:pseudouridine synthase